MSLNTDTWGIVLPIFMVISLDIYCGLYLLDK